MSFPSAQIRCGTGPSGAASVERNWSSYWSTSKSAFSTLSHTALAQAAAVRIHRLAAQVLLVDAHIQRAPNGGATLQVEARDNSGKPMSGLKFQGRFERPTDRRADQPIALAETGLGIYRGSAAVIAPGQWDLVLEGGAAGRRMFLSKNRVLLN